MAKKTQQNKKFVQIMNSHFQSLGKFDIFSILWILERVDNISKIQKYNVFVTVAVVP